MKKQFLALALTVGIGMIPVAANAAPTELHALAPSTVTATQSLTNLGTFYYSPAIGQESATPLTFNAGVSTLLQLDVTQSTLALNTPSVQFKLYSGGVLMSSQTVTGTGSRTISFSVTPGKSYYVNVKNTGNCSVNGSFTASLN
ncbi:hypothetical protein [Tumebacillus flagellatus]|uniref:Peptidase C-terminal archaeal/bacterial domain-containing protein n=1 Tax=Tumebacillus flagellatus TaxID=1157490 RepID=A0A074LS09_9BACL|nr:hypothetical protein [Tumebacillus flagellatus]KEO83270.1 hypothetical protein EL26_11310 [Tumebacillus flagellatus]